LMFTAGILVAVFEKSDPQLNTSLLKKSLNKTISKMLSPSTLIWHGWAGI